MCRSRRPFGTRAECSVSADAYSDTYPDTNTRADTDGGPEPVVPLPSPLSTLAPLASPSPFPTLPPLASPTPLPDGTMPLTPPPMPTPALPDASTLSDQLNLPLPAPGQLHEPLAPGTETDTLKDSERLAMQQKMIMADFEKSLAGLIAQAAQPECARHDAQRCGPNRVETKPRHSQRHPTDPHHARPTHPSRLTSSS